MGRNIARLFYELGIFVFFLYSSKVLSAPPNVKSIVNEMQDDITLCKVPAYLYQNNITKECDTVSYPEKNLPISWDNAKSFLCLALYDTWHKQCQNSSLQVPFKDATAFESYIQKFLPGKDVVEQTSFCENIKNIKFSYEKLKPFLSHVNFDNLLVCYKMCLNMTGEVIPLCGILAWSKSIDNKMKEVNNQDIKYQDSDILSTKLVSDANQHIQEDSNSKFLLDKASKETTQKTVNTDAKHIKTGVISTMKVTENNTPKKRPVHDNQDQTITKPKIAENQLKADSQVQTTIDNDDEAKTENRQQLDIINDDAKSNTANSKMQTDLNNIEEKDNTANSKIQTNMNNNDSKGNSANSKTLTNIEGYDAKIKSENPELQTNTNNNNIYDKSLGTNVKIGANKATSIGHGTTNNRKESSEILQKAPNEKDELEDPKNVDNVNDDIKISMPSQNTQDHENSANEYDNPMEDEKFDNDPNEGADQPLDTAEQAQSVPEPSEQRDMTSHYHSIRADEESHFFTYFTIISLISIAAYIGYHNKQKILAIVLEGRRSRSSRGRRRPSTANYRKLDCTLEEAVTSQCNANVTHVIY